MPILFPWRCRSSCSCSQAACSTAWRAIGASARPHSSRRVALGSCDSSHRRRARSVPVVADDEVGPWLLASLPDVDPAGFWRRGPSASPSCSSSSCPRHHRRLRAGATMVEDRRSAPAPSPARCDLSGGACSRPGPKASTSRRWRRVSAVQADRPAGPVRYRRADSGDTSGHRDRRDRLQRGGPDGGGRRLAAMRPCTFFRTAGARVHGRAVPTWPDSPAVKRSRR